MKFFDFNPLPLQLKESISRYLSNQSILVNHEFFKAIHRLTLFLIEINSSIEEPCIEIIYFTDEY